MDEVIFACIHVENWLVMKLMQEAKWNGFQLPVLNQDFPAPPAPQARHLMMQTQTLTLVFFC